MYFWSLLHGHGTSACAGLERHADRVDARHELAVGAEHVERGLTHAGHDPHARGDVRGVGELDADVRDRRADRAHRERHDVERAAAHRAGVEPEHLGAHLGRVAPVVGGAGVVLVLAADERAVLDPGHVAGVAARVERVRPLRRVERQRSVPEATRLAQSASYSSSDPSHQWTRLGLEDRRPVLDPLDAARDWPSVGAVSCELVVVTAIESSRESARPAVAVTETKRRVADGRRRPCPERAESRPGRPRRAWLRCAAGSAGTTTDPRRADRDGAMR